MRRPYSFYGSYRTRMFSEIFETKQDFLDALDNDYFTTAVATLTSASKDRTYLLLRAKYKNAHIANDDELQFADKLAMIMSTKGVIWQAKTDKIKALLAKTEDQLRTGAASHMAGTSTATNESENESTLSDSINYGSKTITNHAFNPGEMASEHATSTQPELQYVDDQNVSKHDGTDSTNTTNSGNSSSTLNSTDTQDADSKIALLTTYENYLAIIKDLDEEYANEFKNLFIKIVSPQGSLYYQTDEEDIDYIYE